METTKKDSIVLAPKLQRNNTNLATTKQHHMLNIRISYKTMKMQVNNPRTDMK